MNYLMCNFSIKFHVFWKMAFLPDISAHIAFFSEICGPSAISRFSPNSAEKNSLEYPDLVWNAL